MKEKNTLSLLSATAEISPVDALWVIIQSKSKAVRKALTRRLIEEEQRTKSKQEALVKDTLTRAFEELHAGKVYDDARSMFKD